MIFVIALVTMLILALGIRVAWKKGARGREVQCIGGVLELRAASVELALTINEKLVTESRTEGEQLMHTEVGGLLQGERLAGKLCWALQGSSRAPPRR